MHPGFTPSPRSERSRLLRILDQRYSARGWPPPLTLLAALAECGIVNPT